MAGDLGGLPPRGMVSRHLLQLFRLTEVYNDRRAAEGSVAGRAPESQRLFRNDAGCRALPKATLINRDGVNALPEPVEDEGVKVTHL